MRLNILAYLHAHPQKRLKNPRNTHSDQTIAFPSASCSTPHMMKFVEGAEVIPSVFSTSRKPGWRDEKLWVHGVTWLLCVGTIAHGVFGTLILSSLLFLSVDNSVIIVARYAASIIVRRAILEFELASMAYAMKYQEQDVVRADEFEIREHMKHNGYRSVRGETTRD